MPPQPLSPLGKISSKRSPGLHAPRTKAHCSMNVQFLSTKQPRATPRGPKGRAFLRQLHNSCSCNPSSDCELDRALRKNSDMFVFGMRSDNNSSLLFGLTSSERHKDHGWSDRQSLDLLTAVRRGTCTIRHEMFEATALSPWDPTSVT